MCLHGYVRSILQMRGQGSSDWNTRITDEHARCVAKKSLDECADDFAECLEKPPCKPYGYATPPHDKGFTTMEPTMPEVATWPPFSTHTPPLPKKTTTDPSEITITFPPIATPEPTNEDGLPMPKTGAPTDKDGIARTDAPTRTPTKAAKKTPVPTREPTKPIKKTAAPTPTPTEKPSPSPTLTPTEDPTTLPPTTDEPSFSPTHTPTEVCTLLCLRGVTCGRPAFCVGCKTRGNAVAR